MKLLLDTHALIWYYDDLSRVPTKTKNMIKDPKNQIYVSLISIWEIAILINIGKLKIDWTLNELLEDIKGKAFKIVPIKQKHIFTYLGLPLLHRDPFDRLLIATSISENLIFVTHDKDNHKTLNGYGNKICLRKKTR
jgi:PIN domain nuclease of toxin-antitoxin system